MLVNIGRLLTFYIPIETLTDNSGIIQYLITMNHISPESSPNEECTCMGYEY